MKSVITGIFLASWRSPTRTRGTKSSISGAAVRSPRRFGLWEQVIHTDLTKEVPALDLPVYFLPRYL